MKENGDIQAEDIERIKDIMVSLAEEGAITAEHMNAIYDILYDAAMLKRAELVEKVLVDRLSERRNE